MATDVTSKEAAIFADTAVSGVPDAEKQEVPLTRWERISEVIWDGRRSKEEKQLVQRLDLFIM